jgi:ribosomal protein L12E/L44/L45/RPP1/RPP2
MTLRAILFGLALAGLSAPASAGPATAPHAAACVAALKAQEAELAESVKAGEPREPVLLKVVRSGIAIVGTQYLAGLHEVEARELLKAAEHDFQALPAAAAERRQTACLEEGEALFAHASPIERSIITTAAQRRIRRLTAST